MGPDHEGTFGATDPASAKLRFHTQTGGATLTAAQPETNLVRTAYEAMAAVLGGTQSLHTNSFDEALSLPTEHAATMALRTQQILGFETGVVDTVDPLAGSWFVERLTNEIEARAEDLLASIERMGGAVGAIESGWVKREIEESAYRVHRAVTEKRRIVVGVNRFQEPTKPVEISRPDPAAARLQVARLEQLRRRRDPAQVRAALEEVAAAARGTQNLLPPMRRALAAEATLGEVCDELRAAFGTYRPKEVA